MSRRTSIGIFLVLLGNAFAQQPGTVMWTYPANGPLYYPPVLSPDGTIVLAVQGNSGLAELHALTRTGALKWKVTLPGQGAGAPSVTHDGRVLVAILMSRIPDNLKSNYRLATFGADGAESWSYDFVSDGCTEVAEGGDGSLYMGVTLGNGIGDLRSFTPEGTLRWTVNLFGNPNSSPVILPDGLIAIPSSNVGECLNLVDSGGNRRLRLKLDGLYDIACDRSGSLYLSGSDYKVVDLAGRTRWGLEGDWRRGYFGTVLDRDGNVYTCASDGTVEAFDRNGSALWAADVQASSRSRLIAAADGNIYGCSERGVFALNGRGGLEWRADFAADIVGSPNMDGDGVLYVSGLDGVLRALVTSSGGLADSPWPKARRDSRNSASAFNPDNPVAAVTCGTYLCGLPGETLRLDGSASRDRNGDPLTLTWTLRRKPAASSFALAEGNAAVQTIPLTDADRGRFTLGLWVSDGKDGCSYTEVDADCGVLWRRGIETGIAGRMAVNREGGIFISSYDSVITAYDRNGNFSWRYKADGLNTAAPVIGRDGILYQKVGGREILALSADGHLLNDYDGTEQITDAPAVGRDGQVLFVVGERLVATDSHLRVAWSHRLAGGWSGGLSVGTDGSIFAPGADGRVHILDPDGRFTGRIRAQVASRPALGRDCSCFFIGRENGLQALTFGGVRLWSGISASSYPSPVLLPDNTVVVGTRENGYTNVSAVSRSGRILWTVKAGTNPFEPVAGDSLVYTVVSDSLLGAVDRSGQIRWSFPIGSSIEAVLDRSGRLLVVDGLDNLYAIQTDEQVPLKTCWRMRYADAANSSSLFDVNSPTARISERDTLCVMPGEPFTLSGRASTDPDGDAIAHSWSLIDQPGSGEFRIPNPASADLNLVFDNGQTGRYIFALTVEDGEDGFSSDLATVWCGLKWLRPADNRFEGRMDAPAIDGENVLINGDSTLYAFGTDGSERWRYSRGPSDVGRPVAISEGRAVICSADGWLTVVDRTGNADYRADFRDALLSEMTASGPEGRLYFTAGKSIHALDMGYRTLWSRDCDGAVVRAVGPDGTLFALGRGVTALDGNGIVKWRFPGEDWQIFQSCAVDSDGTLYTARSDGRLYALSGSGREKWHFDGIYGMDVCEPVVTGSGLILCAGQPEWQSEARLYALDRNGRQVWSCPAPGGVTGTPAVGAGGTVFFCAGDSSLHAVDPDGRPLWRFHARALLRCSPTIDSTGTLYFSTCDNGFCAMPTHSPGLDAGPWPKFGRDVRNSGNAFDARRPAAAIAEGDTLFCRPDSVVTLHGSFTGHAGPPGSTLAWTLLEKPEGSGAALLDSTAADCRIAFGPNDYGPHRVLLTVTGPFGASTDGIVVMHGVKWIQRGDGEYSIGTPAFGSDTTVYIKTMENGYALDPSGRLKWRATIPGSLPFVVDGEGRLYAAAQDELRRYLADGSPDGRWKFDGTLTAGPVLQANGLLCFATSQGALYSVDGTGKVRWKKTIDVPVWNMISDSRGHLLAQSYSTLNCFDPFGKRLWAFQTNHYEMFFSAGYGRIYVNVDNALACLSESGRELWRSTAGGPPARQPVIGTDTTVYVVFGNLLTAIDKTGARRWSVRTGDNATTPVIGRDGTVFFSTTSCTRAVNRNGETLWEIPFASGNMNPSLDAGGLLIAGSNDRVAVYTGCGGPAPGPWSKALADSRNTSTVPVDTVIAMLAADTTSGFAPLTVRFRDESLGPVEAWMWSFGTGEGSDQRNPSHTYGEPGTYRVTLTVRRHGAADTSSASIDIRVRSASGVDKGPVPDRYALEEIFPNPFNQTATIRYDLPVCGRVNLSVYDRLGRVIRILTDRTLPAGCYSAVWDAAGQSSGVYFIRMTSGRFTRTRKAILLK